jgi:hypothetical protein
VAISGDYAVVGAFADDGLTGAAYVFARNQGGPGNWGEVKKLVASDRQLNDRFGKSVAISGNRIVVGAQLEDGGCPPANPNCASGSAYIFERDFGGDNNWGEVQKILPNDPVYPCSTGWCGKTFGNSVSISGDFVAVGAIGDVDLGSGAGAAYVFQKDPVGALGWVQVAKLLASDGNLNDKFGRSIGISGNTVVVGAFSADVGGTNFVGAAYVFERDYPWEDQWGEIKRLTASDAAFNDQYGIAVAIAEDAVIVGAFAAEDDDGLCIVPPDFLYCDHGKAYIYGRNTGGPDNWGELQPVVPGFELEEDFFGKAVSITPGAALVGALHKQNKPIVKTAGAAYVFTLPRPSLNFFKYDEPLPE